MVKTEPMSKETRTRTVEFKFFCPHEREIELHEALDVPGVVEWLSEVASVERVTEAGHYDFMTHGVLVKGICKKGSIKLLKAVLEESLFVGRLPFFHFIYRKRLSEPKNRYGSVDRSLIRGWA